MRKFRTFYVVSLSSILFRHLYSHEILANLWIMTFALDLCLILFAVGIFALLHDTDSITDGIIANLAKVDKSRDISVSTRGRHERNRQMFIIFDAWEYFV